MFLKRDNIDNLPAATNSSKWSSLAAFLFHNSVSERECESVSQWVSRSVLALVKDAYTTRIWGTRTLNMDVDPQVQVPEAALVFSVWIHKTIIGKDNFMIAGIRPPFIIIQGQTKAWGSAGLAQPSPALSSLGLSLYPRVYHCWFQCCGWMTSRMDRKWWLPKWMPV